MPWARPLQKKTTGGENTTKYHARISKTGTKVSLTGGEQGLVFNIGGFAVHLFNAHTRLVTIKIKTRIDGGTGSANNIALLRRRRYCLAVKYLIPFLYLFLVLV